MLFFWEIMQGILAVLEIRLAIWFMEWFAKPRLLQKQADAAGLAVQSGDWYSVWTLQMEDRIRPVAGCCDCDGSFVSGRFLAVRIPARRAAVFVAANYILLAGVLDLIAAEILKLMSVQPGSLRLILSENGGYCIGGMALNRAVFFLVGCFLQKRYRGTCFFGSSLNRKTFPSVLCFPLRNGICGVDFF